MSSIVIRAARPDDAAALIALDTVAALDSTRAEAIADWIGQRACYLAECDGTVAGYAVLARHFFGQPMLEMLMVAPSMRRSGIGTALIQYMVGMAGTRLWTSTNRSNVPMQSLLERLGFCRSGIVEGLDDGDPELIYRWDRAHSR